MRIGLTFEEFVDLPLRPQAGADPVFQQAAEMERDEMFPMSTTEASNHLRARGYDSKPAMLDLLVEDGVVELASPDAWSQADVDVAAEHFENLEIFVPYAAMCQALGCRYVDFLRPLREAAEAASRQFGRQVPENDQYFVMHRVPPRGVMDAQGNLATITPSVISFTLCDDIKERLQRGEEV